MGNGSQRWGLRATSHAALGLPFRPVKAHPPRMIRCHSSLSVAVVLAAACVPEEPPLGPPRDPPPAVQPAADPPPPAREPVLHVPILHKVAEGSQRYPADWSFDLFTSDRFTIHTHVLPEDTLVPLHHHPDGDELVFLASGTASWASPVAGERLTAAAFRPVPAFSAVWTPRGTAHAVRNEEPRPTAAVVFSRPPFAQNRYLLDEDVPNEGRSRVVNSGEAFPAEAWEGWTVRWLADTDAGADLRHEGADTFYFVGDCQGTLKFEDQALPIEPGLFVRIPPGLAHRVEVPAEAAARVLSVRVPR